MYMKKKLSLPLMLFFFKIFIIIIMIIFLSKFIINKYFNKKGNIFKVKKREFKNKINFEREEALTRGKNFLNICLEEKLII